MIVQTKTLIGGALPKEQRSHDVQHILRQRQLAIPKDIGVGQFDVENRIVSRTLEPEATAAPVQKHFQIREVRVSQKKRRLVHPASRQRRHGCRVRRNSRRASACDGGTRGGSCPGI